MYHRMSVGLVFCVLSATATADVVATCGASSGWGYYVPGGINPDQVPAWEKDAISKGSLQLIRAGDDFDIVFTDSTGGTVSSKGDGGTVVGQVTQDEDVVVFVSYPSGVFETWVFWLSNKKPTVSFSQAKYATGVRKHSLMVAPCRLGS